MAAPVSNTVSNPVSNPVSIPALRLNHAVLFVSDVERSVRFWTTAFDLEIVAAAPDMRAAFLRLRRSGNHHDLGLIGLGAHQPPRAAGTVGLYHLAWQVDTIDELAQARESLLGLDGYVGESSHGATKSVYGKDPDGNEFEVMWMVPRADWGEYHGSAPVERLDLAAEVARWSGVRTGWELAQPAERLAPGE